MEERTLLEIIYAIIMGIIQGITEWLPISSSGHLSIIQHYSGHEQPIFFDIMLHIGTAVVVAALFRQDIMMVLRSIRDISRDVSKGKPLAESAFGTLERKFSSLIIVASVPIMIAGAFLRDFVKDSFTNIYVVGAGLILTGFILWLSRNSRGGHEVDDITVKDALFIGVFQAIALLPGVSRSGSTICGGLLRGLSKLQAARFSFLLFFPAIIGATVLEIYTWDSSFSTSDIAPTIAGTIAAMFSGYISIRFLLKLIQKDTFYRFSYYCWGLGTFLIIHNLFFM